MAKKQGSVLGAWAFLIGVILAIILGAGLATTTSLMLTTLVIIGIIIGLLNVSGEEAHAFLMSGVVLIIVSSLGQSVLGSISILDGILSSLMAIFVPATIVVAIRNVFSIAKN